LIEQADQWEGLKSLVRVESVRYFKSTGKEEKDSRLYITFNEDNSRKRSGFAAQNYSILNRIALNLLKNEKTTKVGVRVAVTLLCSLKHRKCDRNFFRPLVGCSRPLPLGRSPSRFSPLPNFLLLTS
jgi:hypothetical protein